MKKKIAWLLIVCLMMTAVICLPAYAETAETLIPGVYGLTKESGFTSSVTITPKTTEGAATTSTVLVKGVEKTDYMANVVKFDVTLSGVVSGKYYMVFLLKDDGSATPVPTENNIYYINQETASSESVSFNVYPKDMLPGSYSLYFSSNATSGTITNLQKVAGFSYHVPYVLGDVDDSGDVDIADVTVILNHVVENIELTGMNYLAADVTHDGEVDVQDATKVLNYIVENIDSLEE